eukprot:GFUD01133701.1.p1 GENE.GFUD01133701.1~~GFUD01133701.1.p1  ORF type:complete len:107 (+),score=29.69 GFUD01133701.1:48-368(+)
MEKNYMEIHIKSASTSFSIFIDPLTESSDSLKKKIQETTKIPAKKIKLFYNHLELEDGKSLWSDYNLMQGPTSPTFEIIQTVFTKRQLGSLGEHCKHWIEETSRQP